MSQESEKKEEKPEDDFEAAFKGEDVAPVLPEEKADEKPDEGKSEAKEEKPDDKKVEDKKPEDTPEEEDVLNRRVRKMEGSYGQLKRDFAKIDSTLKELKDMKKLIEEKLKAPPEKPKTKTMAELSEEMEWPEATEARLEITEKQFQERVDAEIKKIRDSGYVSKNDVQQLVQQATEQVRSQIADELALDKVHPGWKDLINTPAFGDWYSGLTEEEQRKGDESLEGSKALLDKFKAYEQARSSKQQKQDLLKGNLPPTNSDKEIIAAERTAQEEFEQAFKRG